MTVGMPKDQEAEERFALSVRSAQYSYPRLWRSDCFRILLFCFCSIAVFSIIPFAEGQYFATSKHEIDVAVTFYPQLKYHHDYVQKFGDLPTYSPREGLGFDPALSGQRGINFIWRILFFRLFANAELAADLLAHAQILVAGVFAGLAVRMLGASLSGAYVAAGTYMFNTHAVSWIGMSHSPAFFAGFGIALFGTLLLANTRHFVTGWLGVVVGLAWCTFGGHLQNAFVLYYAIVIVAAASLACHWRSGVAGWGLVGRAAVLAAAVLTSLLLTTPTWLSFMMLQSESIRQGGVLGVKPGSLALSHLRYFFGPLNLNMNANYYQSFVALPLVVALILRLHHIRSRHFNNLISIFAIIAFTILVGSGGPFFKLLEGLAPGWSVMSNLERLSFLLPLPISLFCGLGMTIVEAEIKNWRDKVPKIAEPVQAGFRHGVAQHYAAGSMRLFVVASLAVLSVGLWAHDLAGPGLRSGLALTTALVVVLFFAFVLLLPSRQEVARMILLVLMFPLAALATSSLGWSPQKPEISAKLTRTLEVMGGGDKENEGEHRWISYCIEGQENTDYFYLPGVYLLSPTSRWVDIYESFVNRRLTDVWRSLAGPGRYDQQWSGDLFYHRKGDNLDIAGIINRLGVNRILADAACPVPPNSNWLLLRESGRLRVYENRDAFPFVYTNSTGSDGSRQQLTGRFTAADMIQISGFNYARDSVIYLSEMYSPGWVATDQAGRNLDIFTTGLFMRIEPDPQTQEVTVRFRPWYVGRVRFASMVAFLFLVIALFGSLLFIRVLTPTEN